MTPAQIGLLVQGEAALMDDKTATPAQPDVPLSDADDLATMRR